MNTEIKSILSRLEVIQSGGPWYGRSVSDVFSLTDKALAFKHPSPGSHSLIDLLYHMITWQDFTLRRLQKIREDDPSIVDKLDWRVIDPVVHTWDKGVKEFHEKFEAIKAFLESADDSLLEEKVDYREYNFRVLLNGLADHNIYHIGQVAYVQKFLKG